MRNVKRLEKLIGLLIGAMGEDVNREGLIETPERALRGWSELLCGYSYDDSKLYKTFKFTGSEFITVRGIEFTSICEHHLLPFYGLVTVGYIPDGRILGLSKFGRIVDCFSKRLQLQEKLTCDIGNSIVNNLRPKDLFVTTKATHCCMTCRGIMKSQAEAITIFTHGKFKNYSELDLMQLAN